MGEDHAQRERGAKRVIFVDVGVVGFHSLLPLNWIEARPRAETRVHAGIAPASQGVQSARNAARTLTGEPHADGSTLKSLVKRKNACNACR
jgi:hypothetical protein